MFLVEGGSLKSACQLGCKMLTEKDYVDLLWTTLAEFPGKLPQYLSGRITHK